MARTAKPIRKDVKMGATSERTAAKQIAGKPVSKAAKSISKKASTAMYNGIVDVANGPSRVSYKSSRKADAVGNGIVKQYDKNNKPQKSPSVGKGFTGKGKGK